MGRGEERLARGAVALTLGVQPKYSRRATHTLGVQYQRGAGKGPGRIGPRRREGCFFFFFTLVTAPRRSLRLKLSDARVYEPQTHEERVAPEGSCDGSGTDWAAAKRGLLADCRSAKNAGYRMCPRYLPYRGTSLIRNRNPVRPYSRTMPRLLWRSWGGGRFLMSEVLLYHAFAARVCDEWCVFCQQTNRLGRALLFVSEIGHAFVVSVRDGPCI